MKQLSESLKLSESSSIKNFSIFSAVVPIPLEPNGHYHIYNHSNGSKILFANDGNYSFFLEKYRNYITPVVDTFCYCLMPNHFHLLVRMKGEDELERYFKAFPKLYNKDLTGFENLSGLISQQFSNLFNAYTKAYNKQQDRQGSLFNRPFKRKPITDEKYLRKLVHYIHYNPVEHGFCEKSEEWKYSSFNAIVSCKPTLLKRGEVIELFNDLENFIYCHNHPPELTGIVTY